MSRFLETIRICDGQPLHLDWHQGRVSDTFSKFYPGAAPFRLESLFRTSTPPAGSDLRWRIRYDHISCETEFSSFQVKPLQSLQLIRLPPEYSYWYKFADRRILELASSRRGVADDVLLIRDGWITDTTVANVAFLKNNRWYTPAIPLLAGTTWKRLVTHGTLTPRPIHVHDLDRYEACAVFNALRDWDPALAIPVGAIGR